jgi:hypothetical protein
VRYKRNKTSSVEKEKKEESGDETRKTPSFKGEPRTVGKEFFPLGFNYRVLLLSSTSYFILHPTPQKGNHKYE